MTARATSYVLPIGNSAPRSPGWWAMVWTIATEASLFAYFLFGFFYLGSQQGGPWPETGPLSLRLAVPDTIVLVVSSFMYYWAERGIRRGDQTRLRIGLLLTFLLGAAFVVVQAIEWSGQPFTARSSAFGSLFYTITGFHGAHVVVGLLMNLVVQIWAWRGVFTTERHLAVTNAGLYWHFVDIVWLFVFTSLYLTPRWG